MNELLTISAVELARRIREREVSPVAVVDAHIQRIAEVNGRINAVVTPMFQQAREAAHAAQQHIEDHGSDDLPPLFGVPVTIKDCWPVRDVRFTGGMHWMRDNIAAQDAPAVAKLREAGAIIVGKTNLPDACWSAETVNPIFGRTNNPHHTKYSAGGSSGGEGAIIAAGGSPLGLGSDIAGSVRVPAAFNGCVSLKPTGGRIPAEDHVPRPPQELYDWNTAGPLARRIEDLALALEVLSRDPVQDFRSIDLEGRRCVVYIHNGRVPVQSAMVEAVSLAAGALKQAGMAVVRDDTVPLFDVARVYAALFSQYALPGLREALGGGKPYGRWREARNLFGAEDHISRNVLFFTEFMDLQGRYYRMRGLANFGRLSELRQDTLQSMGTGGVLLTPLHSALPPRHGWVYGLPRLKQMPYTLMFNALELPAVVVPVGYHSSGLPMAVQVVAGPGEDEVALAVAAKLEAIFGGWRMAAA